MPTKQLTFSMKEYDRGGFVSVAEVAKKTSLSLATIYKEIESGRMVAYSLCGKYVLKPADVERWALININKVIGVPKNAGKQRAKMSA
ncbi:hypothetical protein LCGC14_2565430 [marine sediment metagenome]|uniref:Helix-turn-helix domain-containing protein n=1 Tax=marine sediment metagenome TaxID=412755 RepID=A0A0F9AJA2_9ZZZZ